MKLFMLFLFLLTLPGVAAQGIGISPATIEFDIHEGEYAERQVKVYTGGGEMESFAAETDIDGVAVVPGSGTVDGEKRIILRAYGKKPGRYEGKITVKFDNGEANGMRINPGAMVRVVMNVREEQGEISPIKGLSITSGIVLVGLAGYFAWKKQPKLETDENDKFGF